MQTDFADNVGKSVGLVRGLEGSKAEHQTIKQYYANVNTAVKISPEVALDIPEKKFLESKESYENRVLKCWIKKCRQYSIKRHHYSISYQS